MNKIVGVALFATFMTFAQNKSVVLDVEIKNPNSDSIVIHNKEFKISLKGKNGVFSKKFEAPKGFYQFFDGAKFAIIYLNQGYDLSIKADGKRFDETLSFFGTGSSENNYLLFKKTQDRKIKESFGDKLPDEEQLQLVLDKRFSDAKLLLESDKYDTEFRLLMLTEYEKENERIKSELIALKSKESGIAFLKNTDAPEFNFENHKGGKTALSSLKGKIIYIDIWATWCGPCRKEIPYLKKLEEEFHDQKVEFVSISIDELKDHEKWKKLVVDKDLKGIQLIADNAWQSNWIKHFKIEGIPRFIIIGTDGKILNPDAPRPSSSEISTILSGMLK